MMRARIRLADIDGLDILGKSISPEASRDMPRTKIKVEKVGDELVVDIEAEDISSLRAALNSYLRWLKLAMETREIIGE